MKYLNKNFFVESIKASYNAQGLKEPRGVDNFENKSQFENFIIQNVINKLENIIKIINPKRNIYIAFDGIPPLAKLSQQKNRRYKSFYQATLFKKTILWDTSSITPGTNFMKNLDLSIYNYFKNKYNNLNIIISCSDIPGEGEHKLFNYLRNNKNNDYNTVIYGMDADLIMLCLNHLNYATHYANLLFLVQLLC